MATLRDLTPEEMERDELARSQGLASLAGPARDMSAGRPSMGSGGGGIGPAGGGGYVGLDRYAAANQGATQALGNKVVGSVSQAGTDARTALAGANTSFNSALDAGTVRTDQSVLGRLTSDAGGLAKDASGAGTFAKMRDANYTGPNSLEDSTGYAGLQSALGKADETRTLSGSDQGVSQLSDRSVDSQYGQRSTGGRALDTALLLGDQTLRGRLNTAREGLAGLAGEVSSASTAAQGRAGEAQKTTAKTREDTRTALANAQNAFDTQLNQRVDQNRLEAFYRGVSAQDALKSQTGKAIPTAGAQGVYRSYNSAGQPVSDVRGAQAGNVPEFIDNTSGQQALAGFNAYLPSRTARAPTLQELGDLGLGVQQWAGLGDLSGVRDMANAAAIGTSNVNPYSFLEQYDQGVGDLSRFINWTDPNVSITRDNTASAADYAQAGGLASLAGPELSRFQLDPAKAAQAGTANLDIVDFDLAAAQRARQNTLASLAGRTQATIQGNARSGGDTFIKKYGQALVDPSSLWTGPLAPLVAAGKAM